MRKNTNDHQITYDDLIPADDCKLSDLELLKLVPNLDTISKEDRDYFKDELLKLCQTLIECYNEKK